MYFDRQGRPIDMWEFARLMEDRSYQQLASTTRGPYHISTVWLGIDHGFASLHLGLEGDEVQQPIIIFETMIFADQPDCPLAEEQWRYATESQARQGHAFVVALVERELELTEG